MGLLLGDYRPKSMLTVDRTPIEKPRFPVVDAHNHVSWGDTWYVPDPKPLLETMAAAGVEAYAALIGDVPGDPREMLALHLRRFKEPHPEKFVIFAPPDWRLLSEPRFGEAMAKRFREYVRMGAEGLKVWKNLGLRLRDASGARLAVNDPRLDPLFEEAAALKVPVIIHIADPVAFFRPLDASNENYEELCKWPDWHFYGPEFPPFEAVMEEYADLIRRHKETLFIGAHVGCYAENLAFVGQMLRECPNYFVDMSSRIAQLGRQPNTARRFFLEFQDRIMFGTDLFPPVAAEYFCYYRFLETEDDYIDYSHTGAQPTGRWQIHGIHLPDEVLAKVYYQNAARLLGLKISAQ